MQSGNDIKIWLVAAFLAAVGSSASAWQLSTSLTAHVDAAKQLAASLSNAAAHRLSGALYSIDVMLGDVSVQIGSVNDSGSPRLSGGLGRRLFGMAGLDEIAIVDADGRVVQLARGQMEGDGIVLGAGIQPDFPIHASFAFQSEHWRERRMFVAPPRIDQQSRQPVTVLSRPVLSPDLRFRGMAALLLRTDFIDQALTSVLPQRGAAAAAFSPEGVLFARQPRDERFIGASIVHSDLYQAYHQAQGAGTSERATSFADGVDRIVGFTPVPNYPVVVAVGITRQSVLEAWYRELLVHGSLQVVFISVIVLMAYHLQRSERRRRLVTEQMLDAERAHVDALAQAVRERTEELHESLAALRESEERFRRIVDISPLALILTRQADAAVIYANGVAEETFHVGHNDWLHQSAVDFWADVAQRDLMISTLAQTGQVRNMEATLKQGDGQSFIALLSAVAVSLQGEDLVLTSVLDITQRKRLEEELGRSNRDLEQFSYAVSHDLQEPLRMVSSYLTLLERRYRGQLDQDAQEFIGFAVDGAQRMSRMITDLLEYSRVHRRGTQFAQVRLDDVLAEALSNLSPSIAENGAVIDAMALPVVMGDPSQLMRVFQNLVGNALKYHQKDVHPHITIQAKMDGDQWRISVADDGIGIDMTHADRLFQVFQRLQPRGEYEGSGVGLALCRRILERHHGRIWAESPGPGQGSTFLFTLPVSPREIPATAK